MLNREKAVRKVKGVQDVNNQLLPKIQEQERHVKVLEEQNRELDKELDRFLVSNHEVVAKLNARKRTPIKLEDLYEKHADKERVFHIGPPPPDPAKDLFQTGHSMAQDAFPINSSLMVNQIDSNSDMIGYGQVWKPNIIASPSHIKKVSFQNDNWRNFGSNPNGSRMPSDSYLQSSQVHER